MKKNRKKSGKLTGAELRKIREGLGLTQAELATELGYDRWKTISEFENGRRPIPKLIERVVRSLKERRAPGAYGL